MATKSNVKIDTRAYTAAYGVAPKGYGRWEFVINGEDVACTGSYNNAKLVARHMALEEGVREVVLLP